MTSGLFSLLLIFPLFFQDNNPSQEIVREILVQGNFSAHTEQEIRGALNTKIGAPLDREILDQDIRFLWSGKRILAKAFGRPGATGITLIIQVYEFPAISQVEIRGNREIRREDLLDAAEITPGLPIDEVVVRRARSDIKRFYRNEGFFFAEVNLTVDSDRSLAIFDIMEGPLVRVNGLEFRGNTQLPAGHFFDLFGVRRTLKSVMQLGQGFLFFRGSKFQLSTLQEDLIQMRTLYRSLGYKDAVVEVEDLRFNKDRDRVVIHVLIHEGPRYIVSSVDITGNEAIPREELLSLIDLSPGDPYTISRVRQDGMALQRYYGERGYPSHPSVTDSWVFLRPEEKYSPDEAEVKVIYRIKEGKQIKIRDVIIRGNVVTQDRIVRRELTFFPGEEVNTTQISRSLSRLSSLNFFKNEDGFPSIEYLYEDADQPDFKDLVIEVEEGTTGYFRIGGGVSSTEGPFANVWYQKSNFDILNLPRSFGDVFSGEAFTGGGQDLDIFVTPGTVLSTYRIRFREPDLFGDHIERTSLDSSLYFRRRFFSTYREDRRGGKLP